MCGGGGGDDPAWPAPGDLAVVELMQDPAAVSDSAGEWFELFNKTGASFELAGCVVATGSDDHSLGGDLDIAAGGRLVLAINADSGANGGVAADYDYPGSLTLGNGGGELTLTCGGVTIASVSWDGSSPGASWQQAPDGTWCAATATYGDGDKGTPGAPNSACDGGGGGGDSTCCQSNADPGCDDSACEAIVCGGDAFCCDTQWDDLCAEAAVADCAVCQ